MSLWRALIVVLLNACTSTSPPSSPSQAQLPFGPAQLKEHCYCGWLDLPEFKQTCAVWLQNPSGQGRQKVLAHQLSSSCALDDCRQFFSAKTSCRSFEAWPLGLNSNKESRLDPKAPCYCDMVVIPTETRGQEACAYWQVGDRYVKEHYFLATCLPETCAQPPFKMGRTYCPNGFRSFY